MINIKSTEKHHWIRVLIERTGDLRGLGISRKIKIIVGILVNQIRI